MDTSIRSVAGRLKVAASSLSLVNFSKSARLFGDNSRSALRDKKEQNWSLFVYNEQNSRRPSTSLAKIDQVHLGLELLELLQLNIKGISLREDLLEVGNRVCGNISQNLLNFVTETTKWVHGQG